MDGVKLLRQAHAAGLRVAAAGDRLVIRGPRHAEAIAKLLMTNKPVVMAALAATANLGASDAAYWREWFEERVAIRQFDAGYPKATAERLAFGECIETWCRRNPIDPDPARCAGCGKLLAHDVLDLPDSARVHFESEREFRCLIDYGLARKHRAVIALAALGLTPPAAWEA